MTTANDLCVSALRKSGILALGQPANSIDINDAFTDLNDMLAQWQRQRWLIWCLVDTAYANTGGNNGSGSAPFTVGIGGNFNIARPDRIEGAYFRQLVNAGNQPIDYPLEIIEDYTDYAELVALKSLQSFPSFACYRPDFPTGSLFVYPAPLANLYETHILTKAVLNQFTNLTSTVLLPPEYNAAIKWNLTVRLRASYDMPENPSHVKLAKEALNIIRGANAQIGRLRLPPELTRPGIYNVFSDQVR